MATVVNNPAPTSESSNGMGFLFGIILLIVVAVLFFVYGLPRLTGGAGTGTGAQVNLPSSVNVHTGK